MNRLQSAMGDILRHLFVFLALLGWGCATAAAQTPASQVISTLFSDKLTMMDLGLIRAERAMQHEIDSLPDTYDSDMVPVADFDPRRNSILVGIWYQNHDSFSRAQCDKLLDTIHKSFGNQPTTIIASWFRHHGYTSLRDAGQFYIGLRNIIWLVVTDGDRACSYSMATGQTTVNGF
ncbi:hypothetical protein ACM0P6_08350 [Komagataeibacter sucrofermentans]|nr:hypothetical protein [Komagataeibacter sucrofermentans]